MNLQSFCAGIKRKVFKRGPGGKIQEEETKEEKFVPLGFTTDTRGSSKYLEEISKPRLKKG